MFEIYIQILKSCWKTYGLSLELLRWLIGVPLFLSFTRLTLWLDNLFFPQFRNQAIDRPIFIIGNPRSGTSFLHRLLTQTEDYSAFQTWHLLFPSLTARAVLKPIINWLIRTHRTTIMSEESGHGLFLNEVEHDEFLFMYRLDTQFLLLLSPLAFSDREYPELRFHDQQSPTRRHRSVEFYRECLQRHLYYTGANRAIAQAHYSTHRVKTLLEIFPDAKFVYVLRSPLETIPSHLSLDRVALESKSGIDNLSSDVLKRYYQRRYQYDIDLYQYFCTLYRDPVITNENFTVISYDDIKANLSGVFERINDFAELKSSDRLQELVARRAKDQKSYTRKHSVGRLDDFGLTEENISEDFSFILANDFLSMDKPVEDSISAV